MSTHAETAKYIRKELKQWFPKIKFTVRSEIFAGGNSVNVSWENGPTNDKVDLITSKYQYGHFNCMTDGYENTNRRSDLPQVKYVQTRRNITDDIMDQVFKSLQKNFVHFDEVSSIDEINDNLKSSWSVWTARDYIYRKLINYDLTNGYLGEESDETK